MNFLSPIFYVGNTIANSGYIITIIMFFLIVIIVNTALFKNGHFGDDYVNQDLKSLVNESFYYTTTQFSTVGYGDISPKTGVSKFITGFFHFMIIFITYKLSSEFGIMTHADKEIENSKYAQCNMDYTKTFYDNKNIQEGPSITAKKKFQNAANATRRVAALGKIGLDNVNVRKTYPSE